MGKKCPGYRDESDLLFRVEDPSSFADGATRDRRRRRSGRTPPGSRQPSKSPTGTPPKESGSGEPSSKVTSRSSSTERRGECQYQVDIITRLTNGCRYLGLFGVVLVALSGIS